MKKPREIEFEFAGFNDTETYVYWEQYAKALEEYIRYKEQLTIPTVVVQSEQQIKAMIITNIIDNCTIGLDNTGQERYSLNEEQFGKCVDALVKNINAIQCYMSEAEQFYCWESGEAGVKNPLCDKQCDHCAKLYPKQ